MNWCGDHLQCEGHSSCFEWFQVNVCIRRRCRIEQHSGPVYARRNLLKQFHPLTGNRRLHNGETGGVATRPRQALDEAAADRIGNDTKMIGMVRVCCNIDAVGGVFCVTMRSGCNARSSLADRCRNSASSSAPSECRFGCCGLRSTREPEVPAGMRPSNFEIQGRSRHAPSARRCAASDRAAAHAHKRPRDCRPTNKTDELPSPHAPSRRTDTPYHIARSRRCCA